MTTKPDSFSEAKELSRLDDPAVRKRCIKLNWRSNYQNWFSTAAFLFLIPTFFLLQWGYVGHTSRYGNRYTPPSPSLIPFGYATLGMSLALFASLLGFRNYCLVDPVEQRLYQNLQFLWWRKRQIIFRKGEVLAVTAEGQRRFVKHGVIWLYRLVAVGADGHKEPLSNWRQAGLDKWNARARELAPLLGCESYPAPPQSAVVVEERDGQPMLTFGAPSSPPPPKAGRIAVLLLATAVPMVVLLYYFIVMKAAR